MEKRNRIIKLLVALMALCAGGTAVILLVIRIFFGGVLKEPASVEIEVAIPNQVVLNEPFAVTLQLTNIITASQTLHSLDFEEPLLEQIKLTSASPSYQSVQSLPLSKFASYEFNLELPADIINRPTVVELTFVGQTVGEFSGLMDVCLGDGTFCKAVLLETAVVEK